MLHRPEQLEIHRRSQLLKRITLSRKLLQALLEIPELALPCRLHPLRRFISAAAGNESQIGEKGSVFGGVQLLIHFAREDGIHEHENDGTRLGAGGKVENANGRLRRCMPRQLDIDNFGDDEPQEIITTCILTPENTSATPLTPLQIILKDIGKNVEI